MNGLVIDLILAMVIVAAVLHGWRRGAIQSALTLLVVAIPLACIPFILPTLTRKIADPAVLAVVLVLVLLSLMLVVGVFTGWIYRRLRVFVGREPPILDHVIGSSLQVLATGAVVWIVATAAIGVQGFNNSYSIQDSKIYQGLDSVVGRYDDGLRESLIAGASRNGLWEVPFDPSKHVLPPDSRVIYAKSVREAGAGVVKILGISRSCQRGMEGSGFVYSQGLVATNAHVVAGTNKVVVETDEGRRQATVVVYNPNKDVAILRVPDFIRNEGTVPVLPLAQVPAQNASSAVAMGYPENGPFKATPVRIMGRFVLQSSNIYSDNTIRRDVYSMRGDIRQGNSGGPIVNEDGAVLGMIFGAAANEKETGYALSLDEISSELTLGRRATEPISTQECAVIK